MLKFNGEILLLFVFLRSQTVTLIRVKEVVTFCVKRLLQFELKKRYILRQMFLQLGLMLHFASKFVQFCGVTLLIRGESAVLRTKYYNFTKQRVQRRLLTTPPTMSTCK